MQHLQSGYSWVRSWFVSSLSRPARNALLVSNLFSGARCRTKPALTWVVTSSIEIGKAVFWQVLVIIWTCIFYTLVLSMAKASVDYVSRLLALPYLYGMWVKLL